jgi:hypothetical protein
MVYTEDALSWVERSPMGYGSIMEGGANPMHSLTEVDEGLVELVVLW